MARLLKYKIGVGRRLLAFLIAMLLMTSYINIISPFISFAKGEDIITETESQKITNFSVRLVSGANNIGTDDNPDYVWVATKHDAKHRFVYQMDYDLSGEGFLEPNTVQFVIPKYIIKDRNNNWANNYELAIPINTDVPEDDNENIFVYKEDGNNILVYNRLQVSAAEKGSIQFAYDTNKSMLDYVDMRPSEILYAEFNIDKNVNEHLHTVDDITRVKIDTTATIGSSSQSCELYETWKSSWGNASDFGISNPDDYYYLYWKIKTKISFVTQPYTFRFNSDTVTGSNGNADFVAVRMGEYGNFSSSFIDSNIYRMVNGEINQYVITKHLKSTYGNLEEYYIKNSSVISLHPIDNIDSNTEAISSGTYNMKRNNGHAIEYPITSLYFMKYGYNTWSNTLSLKNQPVNYELSEFTDNNIDNIHNNMSYNINMSAYAYLFTIQDGYRKEDTEYYGCKDIKYSITDEDFYLNDSITDDNIRNNILPNDLRKLTYNDFEITSFNYDIAIQSASWVDYRFVGRPATSNDFENNNTLDFYAKFGSNNNWIKIGSKNMKTSVITKDDNYVKYFSSDTVEFKDEVSCVGIKVETSNKLYSTSINIKPKYKLKNSDYVKNIANTAVNSGDPKIWVTNKANCKMSVDDTEFFNSDKYARNIIVGYIKVSKINKNSSFVNINKVKKLVNVGWNASVSESYNTQNGICYVKQESGKFYDLLPVGSDVNKSTITVKAGKELNQSDYDVQTITNYKGTGRTLLIINIKVATETQYNISYSTVHSMESLYDYGTTVRNTLAYETGNNVIANGFADNGGDIIDADIMNDLDSSTDDSRFIYTDSSRILDLLFAVNSGLTKMVKASSDTYFSRNTTVHQSNYYTYRLRYANDFSTRAKNIIFYDNIENYTGSIWQGELQSIDVSQIKNKGVSPIIYLSDKNVDIGVSANRNLTNDSIWTTMDNFGDLSKAKSIAIDLSKKDDNSDFVLNQNESVVILLNMLSPDTDPGESLSSDKIPAKALNSIYLDSDMMTVFSGQTYNHNLLHWYKDTVEYKTMGDVLISKVDARDNITPVKDISFSLIGVSNYGTVVSEEKESDINGLIDFKDIEKGSYTLTETSGSKDYQKINETINVVINADGSVSYNGETLGKNARYVISDEPRIHTDIKFTKRDITNKSKRIAGVKFHLYGTSEYNNFVSKTAISDNYGNVVFEDIELGHYELEELTVADGYVEDNSIYKVFINEQGKYSIDDSIMEKDGTLSIYNEPYHSFTIQKESFTEIAGIAMPVEGAVFILVGNSDRGTSVNMTRTSGANGKLTFSGLESGSSYILREIDAPDGYAIDDVDHIVKIAKDGKVTISGLNKNSYGEFVVKDKEDSTVTVTKKWVDNETNETRTVEPKIHLGVNESMPVAYFGSNLSSNNTSSYGNSVLNLLTSSSDIKAFKPFNGTKSEAISAFKSNTNRCIDDGTTDYRIYAWYISDSSKPDYGTVYWWSDAKVVYLTDKSHELFSRLGSVKTIDVSGIDVSKVTDMSNMFYNNYSLTDIIGLDSWDVSNVANISYMFYQCSQLTSIEPLENWNTSNVTDMSNMFYYCLQLTSIEPLENWDVSNVTNMSYMFSSCSQLTSIEPLENWNVSNVTDMSYMFYNCLQLTSIEPLENWNTSNVTNMQYMFFYCLQLTSIEPLENWNTSNVTDMSDMFCQCINLSSVDLHNWDVSNVLTTAGMFYGCNQLVDVNINNWNCAEISDISCMFCYCSKLEYIHSDNWIASKLNNIYNIFSKCYALKEVNVSDWDVKEVTSLKSLFADCWQLQNLDLTNWDVSNVTDTSYMFYNCSQLTSIQGLENWNTSNVTDMRYMFSSCSKLTSIEPLRNWNVSNVTNMSYMFYKCSQLTSIQGLEDWDVSNVTNMSYMFSYCEQLTSIQGLEDWDVSNVTNMSYMFFNCLQLTSIQGLEDWDVSNVTNMNYMFYSCNKLTSLSGLENWDTSSVTDMSSMFYWCSQLTSLSGLENWDVSNVTDMSNMFSNCSQLTSIQGLEDWNVSNVTDMRYMFNICSKLTSLQGLENWDVSNVTDMSDMFNKCSKIESIDLSNWNTVNLIYIDKMFYSCSELTYIDLSNWNTNRLYSLNNTFCACQNLVKIYATSSWDRVNSIATYNKNRTFYNCINLNKDGVSMKYNTSKTSGDYAKIGSDTVEGYFRMGTEHDVVATSTPSDDTPSDDTHLHQSSTGKAYFKTTNGSYYDPTYIEYWGGMRSSNISNVKYFRKFTGDLSILEDLIANNKAKIVGEDDSGIYKIYGWFVSDTSAEDYGTVYWWSNAATVALKDSARGLFSGLNYLIEADTEDIDVSEVNDFSYTFNNCYNITTLNLRNWVTNSSVFSTSKMFYSCKNLESIQGLEDFNMQNVNNTGGMFYCCSKLTSLQGLENWNVSNVTDMSNMFSSCSKLTSLQGLEDWNISNVTTMYQMFDECSITSVEPLENWNTSNVTNMSSMFSHCRQLTSLQGLEDWNVSNVTDMSNMFYQCSQLTSIEPLENWNVSNVTNMHRMFSDCSQLTSLQGLADWNVSNVTDMSYMFSGCSILVDASELRNWDVSNVTDIAYMFYYCYKLINLDLSKWEFNSLESMCSAFSYCYSLRELDVSNWDTSNVSDMSYIFSDCRNLIQIKGLETWNTINVTNMSHMFYNCSKITDFNISNWSVDNIVGNNYNSGFNSTFCNCSSVKTIDLSGWSTIKLVSTKCMFYCCNNLETIYVSDSWNLDFCQYSVNMFYGCQKLVGEKGTKQSNSEVDKTRARIDRLNNPGYLTYKKPTPKNIVEVYDSTDERCQLEKATDDNWYYTFTELDPSLDYYAWEDEMENYTSVNMTKSRAVGVVDGTATITNKTTVNPPTFGSLKISKNILNNDGTDTITSDDASKQFLFITAFVDGEGNIPPDNIYDIVKTHDGVESTTKLAMIDGKLQLLLSDNDIVMIRDIPTGYKYTITEALDDKFTMSVGSGALTGTITENKVSTTDILNTKVPEEVEEFVTFKLKKVVVGNYIDASEKFTFSLNFTGLKPNEIYNIISNKQSDITYKANKNGVGFAEVKLIDGEELTITVPKDSVYVISESGGNYISSYKIIDNAGLNLITKSYDTNFKKNQELSIQSETADLNEDIEITFTNKKLETQKLTLQKELINVSQNNSDMFDFTVEITDLEDGTQISSSLGTLTAEDSNEIVVQFPLAANTPVEFYNIPVNAKYKITEAASDYIASYKIYDTEHNELESGANTEVNKALETGTRTVTKDVDTSVVYSNKKVSCDITIRKEIDMKYGILTEDKYRYTPFTFDISLTGLTKPLNQIDVQYIDDSITGVVTKKLSQVLGITDENANEVRSNVNLTVELFNGQAIKIKDMPKNATCSVKERASNNYIASYKVRGNDAAVIQAHDTANDVKNMELSMDVAEVVDDKDTDIVITFTNQYEFPPYELPAAGMNNYWYVLYGVAFIMLILTLAYTYSSYKRRQEI